MDTPPPCRSSRSTKRSRRDALPEGLVATGELEALREVRAAYTVPGRKLFDAHTDLRESWHPDYIEDPHERCLFITLTIALDFRRSAKALWGHARARRADSDTSWLFDPHEVSQRSVDAVRTALRSGNPGRAIRSPNEDPRFWRHNATTWAREFEGHPRVLFERCQFDAKQISNEVRVPGRFLGLKGDKILPLWLRMLDEVPGYEFANFEALDMPVDVHVARAAFTTGLVRGRFEGTLEELRAPLVRLWREACAGEPGGHMAFDEAVWQLGQLGCTTRRRGAEPDCARRVECPIGTTCPKGRLEFASERVSIDV
jgi:hypothetical protein